MQGIDAFIVTDTEEARTDTESYPKPLNVIEGPLMNVIMIINLDYICAHCFFLYSFYASDGSEGTTAGHVVSPRTITLLTVGCPPR